jgi:hypothetical protein
MIDVFVIKKGKKMLGEEHPSALLSMGNPVFMFGIQG